jgi:propanol-preferring alcohol dehydrogenase
MSCEGPREPLRYRELLVPEPGPGQVLLEVAACGVCRTDLHLVDGELPSPKSPVIPGHEIVGRAVRAGSGVDDVALGARLGVPWLGYTCGSCPACRRGSENLCEEARFHGYTLDGGYAEFVVAERRYCFELPAAFDDVAAAPLLCAGLIGYRALSFTGDATSVGLFGFGASAHILAQIARYQGRRVFAFTRPGDTATQVFARRLGAVWAGASSARSPEALDAAIIFAPVGALVPVALEALRPGGVVVCAGIHMSDIPSFPYELLWRERRIVSVANLTRHDGDEFLPLAARAGVVTHTVRFPLSQANVALERLRSGQLQGAAVLVTGERAAVA